MLKAIPYRAASITILTTWVVLLALLLISRMVAGRGFLKGAPRVRVSEPYRSEHAPGSAWIRAGTLGVFAVNIVTFALVLAAAVSPTLAQRLDPQE